LNKQLEAIPMATTLSPAEEAELATLQDMNIANGYERSPSRSSNCS
jgi:hypothetical protein